MRIVFSIGLFWVGLAQANYFSESYSESRSQFRKKCHEDSGGLLTAPIPNSLQKDLSTDYCYFEPKIPQRLVLLLSGVHGIEGFAGSAVQQMFMHEYLGQVDRKTTGVLLVHAVNPYGFDQSRRVNEDNVDLNRNFNMDSKLFETPNPGYAKVQEFLNPQRPLSINSWRSRFFPLRALYYILRYSMSAMRRAALQGQYVYPEGIFYGGNGLQVESQSLLKHLKEYCEPFESLFFVILHTGYGTRGELHLVPPDVLNSKTESFIREVYAEQNVDFKDEAVDYPITGDFADYLVKLFSTNKRIVPMTYEFGTLDSQTLSGSILSIKNMIQENQGVQWGYQSEADRREIQKRFREMFFPSDPEWRAQILTKSRQAFEKSLPRFGATIRGR